jgi:hypothetical protein
LKSLGAYLSISVVDVQRASEKLKVINEKDCIKFKQKAWIEREEWRESIHSMSLILAGYLMAKIVAG